METFGPNPFSSGAIWSVSHPSIQALASRHEVLGATPIQAGRIKSCKAIAAARPYLVTCPGGHSSDSSDLYQHHIFSQHSECRDRALLLLCRGGSLSDLFSHPVFPCSVPLPPCPDPPSFPHSPLRHGQTFLPPSTTCNHVCASLRIRRRLFLVAELFGHRPLSSTFQGRPKDARGATGHVAPHLAVHPGGGRSWSTH